MDSTTPGQVLMARQPIYDRDQKVVAYELLHRDDEDTENAVFRDSSTTTQVLLNAYTSITDAGSVKRVPAFIHISEELLLTGNFPDLPRKQVIIEIPETISPTQDVVRAVYNLARDGYRLVLGSFEYSPKYHNLLKIVQMVKVDASSMDPAELQACAEKLKPFKVTPIAVKIESYEKLTACSQLGFKLFQGHFLSRPKLVTGKKIEASEGALLRLVQELQRDDATPEQLEALIVQDPVLTFKLLRIVNSASFALVRKIDSITDAVVLLGMEQIKRWATLIAMTSHEDKPEELCRMLLIRGSMCENLANAARLRNAGSYFMAGMMSGLHALLDIDQKTMLSQVPISDEIKLAITEYEGPVGETLEAVIAYESGNWHNLPLDVDIDLYETAYRESLQWTQKAMLAMHTG
ncbi:MAG: EAL and HDOD domain-containing protein [Pontibacterium sp.]